MEIQLGRNVQDKITGFKGTTTGKATYLSGCSQFLVAPPVATDGSFKDSQWFDEQRLEHCDHRLPIRLDNAATPGPDRPAPKR